MRKPTVQIDTQPQVGVQKYLFGFPPTSTGAELWMESSLQVLLSILGNAFEVTYAENSECSLFEDKTSSIFAIYFLQ